MTHKEAIGSSPSALSTPCLSPALLSFVETVDDDDYFEDAVAFEDAIDLFPVDAVVHDTDTGDPSVLPPLFDCGRASLDAHDDASSFNYGRASSIDSYDDILFTVPT